MTFTFQWKNHRSGAKFSVSKQALDDQIGIHRVVRLARLY